MAALGAVAVAPRQAAAQQGCCRSLALLGPNPKVFAALNLERELQALGWEPGRDYRLLMRWSNGANDALPGLAAELAAQPVDLFFAAGDQAVIATQRATQAIPIVGICDDMVGSKLVASMARPGGNTTGISILASELNVKRLELLHEIVPQVSRIGVLADPTTIATGPQLESAAQALGIALVTAPATGGTEVGRALGGLAAAGVGAVNVLASPILDEQREAIIEQLNRARLPAIFQWPESAEAGGLAGYGPRLAATIRAAVRIADKILRGVRPADIPVQQPTAFELAINAHTAKAIGIALPSTMLARADEVIE
jgi:putative ABC transport system substrate-binding protein